MKLRIKAKANVITVNYNDSLPEIWNSYQSAGLVDKRTGLYNMYYTIQAKVPGAVAKTKPELPDNSAWQYKRNADKADCVNCR
ncbi:hypothetical protein ACT5GY_11485 [Lactiplantibacillus plantarum]